MLQSKLSNATKLDSKALRNFSQVKSKALLDSENFFKRVCDALDIPTGHGAKAAVARKLDLAKSSVGLWADGEMPGRNSLDSLVKISELGNVSLHWLLTGEGEKLVNQESQITFDSIFEQKITELIFEALNLKPTGNLNKIFENKLRAIIRQEIEIERSAVTVNFGQREIIASSDDDGNLEEDINPQRKIS